MCLLRCSCWASRNSGNTFWNAAFAAVTLDGGFSKIATASFGYNVAVFRKVSAYEWEKVSRKNQRSWLAESVVGDDGGAGSESLGWM